MTAPEDPPAASGAASDGPPDDDGDGRPDRRRGEGLLAPGLRAVEAAGGTIVPAWRRVTQGEPRWPVSLAVLVAIGLQVALPGRVATHPRWLLPGVEAVLLAGIVVANPTRISRRSAQLRTAGIILIFVVTVANAWSAARLIDALLNGRAPQDPTSLLLTGGAIWLTNVVAFSLWYWEMDRGGPADRAHVTRPHPDFLFPQMASPELAPPDWEPAFVDYLYLLFTNAAAFSPTDVLPLARWAKLTMLGQSAVSLLTVALVIARAVNILK